MIPAIIPKKYLIILAAVIAFGVVYYFWRAEIYRTAQSLLAAQINEKNIEIMEKRNEIANNRPDDRTTIERLRDGSF